MDETTWLMIDTLAAELGKSPEARRKARKRGRVPYPWRVPLLELARAKRVKLRPESFDMRPGEAVNA